MRTLILAVVAALSLNLAQAVEVARMVAWVWDD